MSRRNDLPAALTKADVALGLLVASLAFGLSLPRMSAQVASEAIIQVAGQTFATVALDRRDTLRVAGRIGTATIEFTKGAARFSKAPCANKICLAAGWLAAPGEIAVCVPSEILLWLPAAARARAGVDAITR